MLFLFSASKIIYFAGNGGNPRCLRRGRSRWSVPLSPLHSECSAWRSSCRLLLLIHPDSCPGRADPPDALREIHLLRACPSDPSPAPRGVPNGRNIVHSLRHAASQRLSLAPTVADEFQAGGDILLYHVLMPFLTSCADPPNFTGRRRNTNVSFRAGTPPKNLTVTPPVPLP